ncbi:MAG: DUF1549 domain-containing protein [Planctomycetaceae bacterium]|nr:DUF1549 domain-containing protein [Planctomycetaceae bacterium]
MATIYPLIAAFALTFAVAEAAETSEPTWLSSAQTTASQVSRHLERHWQEQRLTPSRPVDDLQLLRRAWLDLAGRVPTLVELDHARIDTRPERRQAWLVELIESPEFALHFGRVLDAWIQGNHAGDERFLSWLRQALEQRRTWDAIFRQVLVPGTDTDDGKLAARFLTKRVKSIDQLTSDTARVFFGVDITCARCHDHPLVDEWKQDHYYGLAAFLHRATEQGKNSGVVIDKSEGEVTFARRTGQQQTASLMFLSGRQIESEAKQNRRELLVSTALAEQRFLSRAAANRVWAWFFGRGLIHPVDQMHVANSAAIPAVLDTLAEGFVASGYDLRQLVGAIVLSRAYERSSRLEHGDVPPESFAAYRLKPLTPWQWSLSFTTVAGSVPEAMNLASRDRRESYLEHEKSAAEFVAHVDPAGEHFQSSLYQATTVEALYLAHHPALQQRLEPVAGNLAARLAALPSLDARASLAWRTILGREPTVSERKSIESYWSKDAATDAQRIAALIWSLVTSSEFRFNH